MSLRDLRSSRLAGLAAAGLLVGLSGCIHPLYGPNGVDAQMEQIEVVPIPDRLGHYLGEELKFQTSGGNDAITPKYRLTVTPKESIGGLIVNLRTLTSDAAQVTIDADYRLVTIEGEKEITKGTASATASYDRSQQRYANVRAARDAEIRAANVVADQIRTRIGIALLDQK